MASTATPQGLGPAVTKFWLTPVPSMLAVPTVVPLSLAQETSARAAHAATLARVFDDEDAAGGIDVVLRDRDVDVRAQ